MEERDYKKNGYCFKGVNSVKIVVVFLLKRGLLYKDLAWSKFFSFRPLFRKDDVQDSKQEVTKIVFLEKMAKNLSLINYGI